MRQRARQTLVVAMAFLTMLGVASCSGDDADGTARPTAVTQLRGGGTVVSEILAQYAPPEAPGYTMYLYQVTIPPGAEIAPHHHPGQQLARIESGTLTYTVVEGTARIGRDGSPTPTETVDGPRTVKLGPGDSVFEAESMIHRAANKGTKPVQVILSSLFATGESLSIPVDR